MNRVIFAMGGADTRDECLNRYILNLSDKKDPAICFLGTATGDSDSYVTGFMEGFSNLPCVPSSLGLFRLPTSDLRGFLLAKDIIYVGGGNTKSMLALWREWKIDTILREAWEQGTVLCGSSAGSICWFAQGTTDSVPGPLTAISCLGFLPGSNSPHYGSEPMRRPTYQGMIATGVLQGGYAEDDSVGLLFRGTELSAVVASRDDSYAYRVVRAEGGVIETRLEPTVTLSAGNGDGAGFFIRPYRPGDESAVIQLWRECGLVVPQNDPARDIARKLRVHPELFLVGQVSGIVAATVMAGYEGHRGWINYLAVAPNQRERGLGRKIMQAAEDRLRSQGCAKINLQVRSSNAEVIEFYRRIGFTVDAVTGMGKRLVDDYGKD